MKFSVIMPAHNEAGQIARSVKKLALKLEEEKIDYELVVVNDNSTDRTGDIVRKMKNEHPAIRLITRTAKPGFGRAIKEGLENYTGDAVVIVMADSSDDPEDVVRYFRKIEEGYQCVFGSRFIFGSKVTDYPALKLFINRLANYFIKLLFWIPENDITNAFKAYRREVIQAIKPIESENFNITVELPLKAISKGFSRVVIPINWYGRESGVSKLKIRESMKHYFSTVMKIWKRRIKN